MPRLLESLESRTLFAATSAMLIADLTPINADAAALKIDLTNLQLAAKTDRLAITADLKTVAKTSGKTNAPLLQTFNADETKILNMTRNQVSNLLVQNLAHTSVADGNRVIVRPTVVPVENKVANDVVALQTASSKPLTPLLNAESTAALPPDLAALVSANPTVTALPTDAAKVVPDLNAAFTKINADAAAYLAALVPLTTDLTTLQPAVTTTPSLIGDYQGSFQSAGHSILGVSYGSHTYPLEIIVTAQAPNSATGSITIGDNSASGTINITELTTGHVTFKVDNTNFLLTLTGNVNVVETKKGFAPGAVISGSGTLTINGGATIITGSFSLTKES